MRWDMGKMWHGMGLNCCLIGAETSPAEAVKSQNENKTD